MKELCVQSSHCLLEKREVWNSGEPQPLKKRGIEDDISNKVTVAQTRVKLESKEDKESRKWKLHRTTMRTPDVRDHIAKAHKFFKEKVITASFGRIV